MFQILSMPTSMLHHSFGGACCLASPSQSAPFNDGLGFVHVLVSSLIPPPQLRVHSLGSDHGENAPLVPGMSKIPSWNVVGDGDGYNHRDGDRDICSQWSMMMALDDSKIQKNNKGPVIRCNFSCNLQCKSTL